MKEETTRINYRGIPVDINISWNHFESESNGIDHIEVKTLDNHPIPLTPTGYRSHFCRFPENFTMAQAITWFYEQNGEKDPNNLEDDLFSSVSHEPHATQSIKQDATPQDIKTFNSEPLIKPGAKANQPSLF
jgi:hypothetical protein